MEEQSVGLASQIDRASATATLELAFAADPVMRWFWPSPDVYRSTFAKFVDAIAGKAFEVGTAMWVDGGRAVALWLPPGSAHDEESLVQLMLETVAPATLENLSAFADAVRELHPAVEHWYLPFTGVDPFVQGRGLGSVLLRHALTMCDRVGLPAYLEASTSRSRLLYERFGFEVVGVVQVGTSPTVWAMFREPRAPDVP